MPDVDTVPVEGGASRVRRIGYAVYTRILLARGVSLRRQLAVGLAAYLLILVLLVAFGINGSSMGLLYSAMFGQRDPHVLLGTPRGIRSDEWLVVAPLTVAQVQEGLPRISELFPGGFDTSIVWDLPYRDWSILMRPHMWGFFFLPLDNAFAMKWWLPFIAMAALLYVVLCLLWRRPVASFAVAGAFAVSPFFQWWFGSGSFWPPACALAACAGTIVLLREERAWMRWLVAAGVAYAVAVAGVALYPPYLIPCIYPALFFCVGWVLTRPVATLPWRARLRRLAPLAVAAVAVVVLMLVYLATRRATVDAVMSTVYPGQRLTAPGHPDAFPWLAMYAGVFGIGLRAADVTGFAPNASEGSSFIFLGLYLLPASAWLVWWRWRRRREVDWVVVAMVAALALLFAFVYVPGWGAVSHLLLLDRVVLPRIVIGLGLASILLLAVVVARLREVVAEERIPWWTTVLAVGAVLGTHALVYVGLRRHAPAVLDAAVGWAVLLLLLTVAVLLFSRARLTAASLLVAVVALVVAGWVNPIYHGVFDMRRTDIGKEIESVDAARPGAWVSVGGLASTAVLRETGVEAFSGVQAWPSQEMWKDIDPNGSQASAWNRYAHVNWTADPAAPALTLVQADLLQLRFDSCGQFAQKNVHYVLSEAPVTQQCVTRVAAVPEGASTFYIYEVSGSR